MLRIILRHKVKDSFSGCKWEEIQTMDVRHDELENRLTSGGLGENGYDITQAIAIEVLHK